MPGKARREMDLFIILTVVKMILRTQLGLCTHVFYLWRSNQVSSKIFRKNFFRKKIFRNFQKRKLEFATHPQLSIQHIHCIYNYLTFTMY